ncbi:hypothetical protein TNCV_2794241 [Trichonephila clavipes]|nr:hypothetical protein TNCV_2794241 [Trichonephila clavipes]
MDQSNNDGEEETEFDDVEKALGVDIVTFTPQVLFLTPPRDHVTKSAQYLTCGFQNIAWERFNGPNPPFNCVSKSLPLPSFPGYFLQKLIIEAGEKAARSYLMIRKIWLDPCYKYSEGKKTATAGSDVVQSGRPIFEDFFQHLWPYIGNNKANVVFQMVKRLWLIRKDP